MEPLNYGCGSPLHEKTVEIYRNDRIIWAVSIDQREGHNRRIVTIEVSLNFAFHVVGFDILVIFHEDQLFSYNSSMRKEMILFIKGSNGEYFFLR